MTNITTDDLIELYKNFNVYCEKVLHIDKDNLGLISINEHGDLYVGFCEDGYLTALSASFSIEQMTEFLENEKTIEANL